ncbi:hypothetical protein [Singulisphaera sp. PoT]|uniref:hypothetical protein n=1 Tax=Singulisphaera sp. PoT TaxID=3411797 RepID=UPI003BF49DBC
MIAGLLKLALRPFARLSAPLRRALIRRFDARVNHVFQLALEPTRAELHQLNEKMDRFLEISSSPGALKDFADQAEAIRAIRAIQHDCDLIREMNPMLNSVLRDLMRLQLRYEELTWRLDDRSPAREPSAPETLPIAGHLRISDPTGPFRSGKS